MSGARLILACGSAPVLPDLTRHLGDGAPGVSAEGIALAWEGQTPRLHDEGSHICLLDGWIAADSAGGSPSSDLLEPRVLAQRFAAGGESVLAGLTGQFLLLWWDRRSRSGFIASDPLGSRPLYTATQAGQGLFATRPADLLSLLAREPGVDETALASWLARRPAPAGRTLFEGVTRLRGGRLARLEPGTRVSRWWRPRYAEPARVSPGAAVGLLRQAMAAATGRALESGSRPGVMLSGGFDSAAVAALATEKLGPEQLAAFSGSFPDQPEMDESGQVAAVAESLGLDLETRRFAGGSALDEATRLIETWGLPPASPNWFVWRPLFGDARGRQRDMLLDGEGGDEVFGCSVYLLADELRRLRLGAFARDVRRIPGMGARPRPRWVGRAALHYGIRGALPPGLHQLARRARRSAGDGQPWLSRRSWEMAVESESPYEWKRLDGPRWWSGLVHQLVTTPDAHAIPAELAAVARSNGIAFAHPWRDPLLVTHALRQPPERAFDPTLDRPVAREAMRDLLPTASRLRTAKPVFNNLLGQALAGPDRGLLEELVASPPDALAPHVDPDELPVLLRRDRGPGNDLDAWRFAGAALWLRARESHHETGIGGPT